MAIRINLESQESCWRAYLNYHCYGNTMGITGEEMGAIVSRWGDQIPTWQKNAQTNDEVKYEFDDSEFEDYKAEGYNDAKEEHGEDVDIDGEKSRNNWESVGVGFGGATGLAGSILGALPKIAKWMDKGAKVGGKANSWIAFGLAAVSCVVSFVLGLVAKNNVANEEEHKAVMEMKEGMGKQQLVLDQSVSDMESIQEKIISLEDEAQTANDDANSNIQDKKTDYDMYKRVFETLKAKIDSGKPLSETEKKLYQQVFAILGTTSTAINDEVDNASTVVNDIYGDIESFSADYDIVAETIGNVQGFTKYAQEIDEATQKSCDKQNKIQKWNVVNAGIAMGSMGIASAACAGQLGWPLGLIPIAIGLVMIGLAGFGLKYSNDAAKKQAEMSAQVGEEIAIRQTTQDMETETLDKYGEEMDAYEGSLDNLSEYEILVPDDTAPPEGAPAVPTSTSNNGASGSSAGGNTNPTTSSQSTGGTGGTNGTSGSNNPYAPGNTGGTSGAGSTGGTSDTSAPNNSSAGYASMVDIIDGRVSGAGQVTYDDTNKVKLSQQYANAIIYGLQIPTATQGSGFDTTEIPKIIAQLITGFEADLIQKVMNGEQLSSQYEADIVNTMSGKDVGDITVDNTQKATEKLKKVINFYKPIFTAAATNGWTL